MTLADQFVAVLTIWRENRGGGIQGMHSVLNVIVNRAAHRGTSVHEECLRPWQFSSMTAKGDPQLNLGPNALEPKGWQAYMDAIGLVDLAARGQLEDITEGATSYYAPAGMPEGKAPSWAAAMNYTTTICGQMFYR